MIERYLERVPFLSHTAAMKDFEYGFSESLHPPSEEELQKVRVLAPHSWSSVWKPRTKEKQADEQTVGLPHPFIYEVQEVPFPLYPLWRLHDCEWNTWSDPSKIGVTDEQFEEFWREYNFRLAKEWLLALPFKPEEQVYLTRDPEITLMLEWGIFVNHWDAFRPVGWILDVVDDDPGWYMYFYHDDVIIFGCTYDYAAKKKRPLTLFEDPSKDFHRSIGHTAGGKRSLKWEKAFDIYLAEVSRA